MMNVRALRRECGLDRSSRVLDIGCGPGRLLTGFLAAHHTPSMYVGLDVNLPAISWAQQVLGTDRRFHFRHLDIVNERYNPGGSASSRGTATELPVETASFDVITLLSVFSHMWLADIGPYLCEIARALAPEGRVSLTAFVEHGVPLEEENPDGYHRGWSGPLHCVRLDRHYFENLIYASGLAIASFRYRHTSDGQSSYVLARGDEAAFRAEVVPA
jgi:SAM-dependent methyltransferase